MKIRYYAIEDSQVFNKLKSIEIKDNFTREQITQAIYDDIFKHIYFAYDEIK